MYYERSKGACTCSVMRVWGNSLLSCQANLPGFFRIRWIPCLVFLLFARGLSAGFCWDLYNSGSCSLQTSGGYQIRNAHDITEKVTSGYTEFESEPFRFRAFCLPSYFGGRVDNSRCGVQSWDIRFVRFHHRVDEVESTAAFLLDAQLKLAGKTLTRENWVQNGNMMSGSGNRLSSIGLSGVMTLTLKLSREQLQKLPSGTHRFTFVIQGRETEDVTVTRNLYYPFVFKMPRRERPYGSTGRNIN